MPGSEERAEAASLHADREILRAMDTSDEVADGASAIEGGLEVGQSAGPRARATHPPRRRPADARAFGDAISAFGKCMAEAKEIGSMDLLRLRALLTAIAIAGFGEAARKPTAVKVLPAAPSGSAETSPRLMERAAGRPRRA